MKIAALFAAICVSVDGAVGPIAEAGQCDCGKPLPEAAFELTEHPDESHRQRKNRGDKQQREVGNIIEGHGHRFDFAKRVPDNLTSHDVAPVQLYWSRRGNQVASLKATHSQTSTRRTRYPAGVHTRLRVT